MHAGCLRPVFDGLSHLDVFMQAEGDDFTVGRNHKELMILVCSGLSRCGSAEPHENCSLYYAHGLVFEMRHAIKALE